MITEEYILPNNVSFKKENASADEEVLRFCSPEVAQRYLNKFSTLDKILANLLIHPQTRRYHAAVTASKMSKGKLNALRNITFYCTMYEDSDPNIRLKLINGKLYLDVKLESFISYN